VALFSLKSCDLIFHWVLLDYVVDDANSLLVNCDQLSYAAAPMSEGILLVGYCVPQTWV
jgi:hypothetical protein